MSSGPVAALTIVTTAGCHFCDDAKQALDELIGQGFPIRLEQLPAGSPEGSRLVSHHRPAMSPLVVVNGEFFSAGRLPRRKLRALLGRVSAENGDQRG